MVSSRKYHLAKSVIYRVYSTIVSVAVIWIFTHSWIWSIGIGLAENIVKIFTYYFYERIWLHYAVRRYKTPVVGDRVVFENATVKFIEEAE